MKVSIVTVVKNDKENIKKTINSVYCQNYKDVEHIIIDGKSKDGTFDIIKKNRKKISILRTSRDKNLYHALNKGIKLASGQIIGILHSGDLYANQNVIKNSVNFIKKYDLDFVISSLIVFNNVKKNVRYVNTSKYFKKFFLNFGIQPPHPTLFIKKNIIEKVNYYSTKYKIVGDFDFFCKLFNIKKIRWQSFNKVTIFQRSGGLSDGNLYSKLKMANDISTILNKNNYFSIRFFFILKLFLKIKEYFYK
jgi:glycosyltransferase involved in cell wall biosynthesis